MPASLPRRPLLLAYWACFLVTWSLIGVHSRLRLGELAVAFVLQVLVGALVALFPRAEVARWAVALGLVVYLGSVGLLRDGVRPAASGYGLLLLLPIIWSAVEGRRGEFAVALAGSAIVLLAPIGLIGGPQYPQSDWRVAVLALAIVGVLGMSVLALVDGLRAKEARYRLLAENSTDLVLTAAPGGAITYASPGSDGLLGYPPEELVGRPIRELMHPDDTRNHAAWLSQVDASGTGWSEGRLRHSAGHYLWYEATVRAVKGPDGAIIERQAAVRLSDERKRLQLTVERQRDAAREMLASENALRKIATLVATGAPPVAVFDTVAQQVAELFNGSAASVVRFDGAAGVGEIVGGWTLAGGELTGHAIDLAGRTATARVYQTGQPVTVQELDRGVEESIVAEYELGGALCFPIIVDGKLWGSVGFALAAEASIAPGAEERLARFGELVSVAIANAQSWETLAHRAATDELTGLANYRTFHELLGGEVERAARHGRALSVAVLDLDRFKQINDTHGHQVGDDVLVAVAGRLSAVARGGEVVARIGGEEFAWLMPETTEEGAYLAAERARQAIESVPFHVAGTVTMSAGVCSNLHVDTAYELYNGADQALYRAKRGGRNITFVHGQAGVPITR